MERAEISRELPRVGWKKMNGESSGLGREEDAWIRLGTESGEVVGFLEWRKRMAMISLSTRERSKRRRRRTDGGERMSWRGFAEESSTA